MPWTAYPLAENITTMLQLLQYGNSVTNSMFGATIPFSIFVIGIVMTYGRLKMEDSIMFSSYVAWFFSMLLKVLGIVGDPVVVVFMLLTAASTLAALIQKREVDQ